MKTQIFRISGMTCMGCVTSVRRVLEGVEGVSQVEVDLNQASVTFDPARVDLVALRAAIEAAGYDVEN
jgi:copper chaperone